jgi:integral membrane sensor domain MASE1
MGHVVPGWWAGDALGTLVIAGAILAWADREQWPVQPRHVVLEAATASIATIVLTWLAFWHWQPSLAYITIPMLVWIGARFGARGAGLAGIFLAIAGLTPEDRSDPCESFSRPGSWARKERSREAQQAYAGADNP